MAKERIRDLEEVKRNFLSEKAKRKMNRKKIKNKTGISKNCGTLIKGIPHANDLSKRRERERET